MSDLIIISGTNREEAISPAVANLYQQLANNAGFKSEVIDLRHIPQDFITSALYENAGKNEAFNIYRKKMSQASKFVFIVPEYNGSFPGVLKAFIDGLEYPSTFTNKKAALVGLSSGLLGSTHSMSHLTDVLNYCGTHVLARKPRLTKIDSYLNDGVILNEAYIRQLEKQVYELKSF